MPDTCSKSNKEYFPKNHPFWKLFKKAPAVAKKQPEEIVDLLGNKIKLD